MEELTISNLQPQGEWNKLLDFLVNKCGWNRESQPLIIQIDYGLTKTVQILQEFVNLTNICNNIAPIEILHGNSIIFKSLLTIREGFLEPRQVRDSENLEDLYHLKILEAGQPYTLKIN